MEFENTCFVSSRERVVGFDEDSPYSLQGRKKLVDLGEINSITGDTENKLNLLKEQPTKKQTTKKPKGWLTVAVDNKKKNRKYKYLVISVEEVAVIAIYLANIPLLRSSRICRNLLIRISIL